MKTLLNLCEKPKLLQYFAKFLSIRTTLRREEFYPSYSHYPSYGEILPFVGGNSSNTMLFACLSRGGAAAKCTIFRKYNLHFSFIFAIIRNSCFRKSRRCTPWCTASTMNWRWSFGRSASSAPRKITWRLNWMSPLCLPRFLCLWTLYPFLDSKLFWQISCTHLYPRMTCLVAPGREWTRHIKTCV